MATVVSLYEDTKQTVIAMKTLNCLVLCLTTIGFVPVIAQQTPPETFSTRLSKLAQSATPADSPALTKFDLDFRGGTPKQLAAAIEKALGRPLNVIVPDEFADTKLPALKMNGVDVSQLFGLGINIYQLYLVNDPVSAGKDAASAIFGAVLQVPLSERKESCAWQAIFLAKMGYPITRLLQKRFARDSMKAMLLASGISRS